MSTKDTRTPLKHQLCKVREKLQKAFVFYGLLEAGVPEEEYWKLKRVSGMTPSLPNLLPSHVVLPTAILSTAIATIDEYLSSIDNMSDDQVAAFYLGLGLRWVDMPYWGKGNALRLLSDLRKAEKFYRRLEKAVATEEKWKVEKEDQLVPLPELVPRGRKMPTEMLAEYRELLEAQLLALEAYSFATCSDTAAETRSELPPD